MEGLAAMNEMCLQELVHVQESMPSAMPPTHQPLQPSVKAGIDSTTEMTALGASDHQQTQQPPSQQSQQTSVSAVRRTPSAGQSPPRGMSVHVSRCVC